MDKKKGWKSLLAAAKPGQIPWGLHKNLAPAEWQGDELLGLWLAPITGSLDLHVGIVYWHVGSKEYRAVHFFGPGRPKIEALPMRSPNEKFSTYWCKLAGGSYPYAARLILEAGERNLAASEIKFGFGKFEDVFTRRLRLRHPNVRLTCATFVAAVLSSLSIELVNFRTWAATDEDEKYIKKTIQRLKQHGDADRNSKRQKIPGRLRASDVASAATFPRRPVPFHRARPRAKTIEAIVRDEFGRGPEPRETLI